LTQGYDELLDIDFRHFLGDFVDFVD